MPHEISVTCHLAQVTFPPLSQPIKTCTQFNDWVRYNFTDKINSGACIQKNDSVTGISPKTLCEKPSKSLKRLLRYKCYMEHTRLCQSTWHISISEDDIIMSSNSPGKYGSDQIIDFTSTILADLEADPIKQGCVQSSASMSFNSCFLAECMLQINYLPYCTTICKC